MESNDFSSGWMDVDKLHCKASKIPSISLKSSITKKIDGLCTLECDENLAQLILVDLSDEKDNES